MAPYKLLVAAGLLAAVSATNVQGAMIVADAADGTYSVPRGAATFDAGTSGTGSVTLQNGETTDAVLQVGGTSSNASIATAIIPFQLPTLGLGQSFSSASFSIGQTSASNGQQVDLYGLGARAASTIQPADYYRGITGGDTTDSTLLQAAFVATTDTFAVNDTTTTSTAGNTALAAYLNAQYASGAGAGQFVFLRLNVTDAFTASNTRLNPSAFESTTSSLRPTITYTTPEPASASLVGLAALGLLARRRRAACTSTVHEGHEEG